MRSIRCAGCTSRTRWYERELLGRLEALSRRLIPWLSTEETRVVQLMGKVAFFALSREGVILTPAQEAEVEARVAAAIGILTGTIPLPAPVAQS